MSSSKTAGRRQSHSEGDWVIVGQLGLRLTCKREEEAADPDGGEEARDEHEDGREPREEEEEARNGEQHDSRLPLLGRDVLKIACVCVCVCV